jgi:hypothetical protein
MSQISQVSQPLYGGGMPSGTAGYAVLGPAIPHEGMSADKIALTILGSSVAAALIGTGIYYLAIKDKSSGKETSTTPHATKQGNDESKNMKAFGNAAWSMNIGDMDRLFNKLNDDEKNEISLGVIDQAKDSDDLKTAKMMFFTFENGRLTHEMEQAFNQKIQSFAIDPSSVDFNFKRNVEQFNSLSDDEKLNNFKKMISNPEVNGHNRFLNQQSKDILKLYYARFIRPNVSQTVHKTISNHAANEFYIHLA